MLAFGPQDAITHLDALVASSRLSTRDAHRCARLADTLRRPARVCLLGPGEGDLARIVTAIMGAWGAPCGALPPAMELHHGPEIRSRATLEDGTTLAQNGGPTEDLLRREPVFLQIDLPLDLLRPMSLLILALEAHPAMYRPALSWAARRSEIAVWCTPSFDVADARIWGQAPERLTQHAYLLETRSKAGMPRDTDNSDFAQSFVLDGFGQPDTVPNLKPLFDRLMADIEDARVADLDMAQLFLHRLGHLAPVPRDTVEPSVQGSDRQTSPHPTQDMRRLLSEPLLYLMSRAHELNGQLARPALPEDWPKAVLAHCTDTIEGLRDRAENWPEDLGPAQSLQGMIDEICDMTTLLQVEGRAEQAQDATALLFQLRIAFEQTLGWETA